VLKIFIVTYIAGSLFSAAPVSTDFSACEEHAAKWNGFFQTHEDFKQLEAKCEMHEQSPTKHNEWYQQSPMRQD
jgi:hypothetical protein